MSRAPITSVIPCKRLPGEPLAGIEVWLNQQVTAIMYVDTARLTTAISPRVQAALALPTTRRRLRVRESQIMGVERAVLDSCMFVGFPQTEVAPLTVYVAPIAFGDGRIGLNYLSQFLRMCYDFAAESLLLTR